MNIRIPITTSATELDVVIAVAEKYAPNIAICFNWAGIYESEAIYNEVKSHDIPFYFSHPVTNLDELIAYVKSGVSDVFISGQLAFDLETVKYWTKTRQEKPIQVRCYPNICQNEIGFPIEDGIKDFFIRPEDISLYDEYIDVIEFWKSVDTQGTLYEIYFHIKEWDGNLQEIIKGLQRNINSYYILGNEFATRRMNCDKKCLKGKRCNLCNYIVDLADLLEHSENY